MSEHPGLTFATLDPHVEEGTPEHERLRAWGQGLARGFHEGRMDEERERRWIGWARADDQVLRGVWPDDTSVADGAMPVATYTSWAGQINVGGPDLLPLHMVTDVTVAPTHRRQGLLRALMTADLADAAAAGRPVAALTVSEGSIYGRFGFAPATRSREVEVDVTSRFALRGDVVAEDPGRLEMAEPAETWDAVQRVFETFAGRTRGAVARPSFYAGFMTGDFDWESGGPNRKLRGVVHLGADGAADGYALYQHEGWDKDRATVKLLDLVATSDTAYLRLWRFLADLDLVERVTWRRARLDDPLDHAVTDPRVVATTKVRDMLWVRVLDVPTALEARPWFADGSVVLDVADDLGHAAGRWRVTAEEGRAHVAATDEPADVRLDVETLGLLYLGGVDVATLHAAGRLAGDPDAVARWAALADGGPAPYCTTGF